MDNSSSDNQNKPFFLVTIDVEGDNAWTKNKNISTFNAKFLPRFQQLCETYELKPTYLTNYEMALCDTFQDLGKDIIKRNTGEIGMHLHAWNTPPLIPLTTDDFLFRPYLIEYPEEVMGQKVAYMNSLIEDIFKIKPISHRSGKWSFNETYAKILVEYGYKVDCSVTPHVSWETNSGDPKQDGGTDFSNFPKDCYFLDLNNISRAGDSELLEIPVTIYSKGKKCLDKFHKKYHKIFKKSHFTRIALNRFFPNVVWLRPGYEGKKSLSWVVNQAIIEKKLYVEFMIHSSELMPGNPLFKKPRHIEALYKNLNILFKEVEQKFQGATLAEFYDVYRRNKP